MAQVENTLGTESSVARSLDHVISGSDDPSAQHSAATPKPPMIPSDKTKDGVRNEELETAVGDARASSGSTGRPNRAGDRGQRHTENRHVSATSQQASPPPATDIGSRVARPLTEALENWKVPDSPDLAHPETGRCDAVVIPDSDDESDGEADHESGGAKTIEQPVRRRTRRAKAPASQAPSRPKRGDRSLTVPPSTEEAASKTPSIGKPTGVTELIGSTKGRKPCSDSGDNGLPKSGSKIHATSSDKSKETTESDKASEAAFHRGLLRTKAQSAKAASPPIEPAPQTSAGAKRKATAGRTTIKKPRKASGSGTILPTVEETADATRSIGTQLGAADPFRNTEETPLQVSTDTRDNFPRPSSRDGSATTEENSACGDEAGCAARVERQLGRTLTEQKKVSFEPLNQNALHYSEVVGEDASLQPSIASGEVKLPRSAKLQMRAPDGVGFLKIEVVVPSDWDVKIYAGASSFLSNGSSSTI